MVEFVGILLFVFLGCVLILINLVNFVRVSLLLEMILISVNLFLFLI